MVQRLYHMLLCALLLPGCGYRFGTVPREGARRLAVPVFENRTLRRGFERDLTRAVQREIKETSPYVLATEADADLILKGAIVAIVENVLVEGSKDQVIEGNIQITVALRIVDRQGQIRPIPVTTLAGRATDGDLLISDQAEFVLGLGEDRDTATREAIKEIAERIAQTLVGPPL